jgi:hypothetical protein
LLSLEQISYFHFSEINQIKKDKIFCLLEVSPGKNIDHKKF